jgi:hypothetical protein
MVAMVPKTYVIPGEARAKRGAREGNPGVSYRHGAPAWVVRTLPLRTPSQSYRFARPGMTREKIGIHPVANGLS